MDGIFTRGISTVRSWLGVERGTSSRLSGLLMEDGRKEQEDRHPLRIPTQQGESNRRVQSKTKLLVVMDIFNLPLQNPSPPSYTCLAPGEVTLMDSIRRLRDLWLPLGVGHWETGRSSEGSRRPWLGELLTRPCQEGCEVALSPC